MTSNLVQDLEWRYSTKKFDPARKIGESDLNDLLEALRLTPSSYGLEGWKFIVVSNPAIREKLKPAAYNQSPVVDASHVIVLCARKSFTEKDVSEYVSRVALTRGVSIDSLNGFRSVLLNFIVRQSPEQLRNHLKCQAYIALGFLLSAAARKRIDACPMEGFDAVQFDAILGLNDTDFTVTLVCPVGYRSKDDSYAAAKKVRRAAKDVIAFMD